jgi:GT2 family glycosyltransferase
VPVSIIVPFLANLEQLRLTLSAVRASMADAEIVVAADAPRDECQPLAAEYGAAIVAVEGPSGPATARNRAAAVASGDVLLFVDADVVPAPDALPGMCRLLEEESDLSGVFGAYDLAPSARNFLSQLKNLSHAYVHRMGAGDASTFWAGLGAMRAEVFRSVGGFDERFRRPSVEDIDLGYRVVARGHRLRLAPQFQGTHLKHWTMLSTLTTDVVRRGIPWTQLIYRYGPPRNRLNLSVALRVSVICAYVLLVTLPLVPFVRLAPVVAATALLALIGLNMPYYAWLARHRGAAFAIRAVPAHWVHHLCNGLSFAIGTVLFALARSGWRLPGALPIRPWDRRPGPADCPDSAPSVGI